MLQILASAVALAYRNFGVARVNREQQRNKDDDPEGYVRRTWQNGVLFAELKRLQAVDADNIVARVNHTGCGRSRLLEYFLSGLGRW